MTFYEVHKKLETEKKIYLVFELFEGEELYEVVMRRRAEMDACYCFYQLVKAMQVLAVAGIVHKYIKAKNFLICKAKDEIKLIDFGYSKPVEKGKRMNLASGSPY